MDCVKSGQWSRLTLRVQTALEIRKRIENRSTGHAHVEMSNTKVHQGHVKNGHVVPCFLEFIKCEIKSDGIAIKICKGGLQFTHS